MEIEYMYGRTFSEHVYENNDLYSIITLIINNNQIQN